MSDGMQVEGETDVPTLKAILEAESGMQAAQQQLHLNGHLLASRSVFCWLAGCMEPSAGSRQHLGYH